VTNNFHFLRAEWPVIHDECQEAEKHVLTNPRFSAILCRSALEKIVHWLFENDSDLERPYDVSLNSLIHAQSFRDNLSPQLFREVNLVRKIGNNGAHGEKISKDEALAAVKCLHSFSAFLAKYYGDEQYEIALFDEGILNSGEEEQILKLQLELLRTKLEEQENTFRLKQKEQDRKISISPDAKKMLFDVRSNFAKRRTEREKILEPLKAIPQNLPESATRKIYIDLYLKESGWNNLREGYELEYEVNGMPLSTNPTGRGFVDYVLWGDNGKPLAVIEAKKTMIDATKGRQQALQYADCLEQMHKQRPVIFYTNGYETHLWDDTFCPPREVQGFYTKDELQLLVDRRVSRMDLRTFKVNPSICGRPYQMEAIQRIAENFVTEKEGQLSGRARRALLVMATGSGKTRTAAGIIEMMTKCNWAKRVLFLADRTALVTQAKKSISSQLDQLTAIDLTKEKEDNGTRLVFSTYPTMMNKIDGVKNEDERFYSPGHFDLIIVDEAHRSVYQKYKAIFDYFDALVIGLTATPKKDVDKNTYDLFNIEDDIPTFAYELNQAVADGYLVPAKAASVPVKFIREGIKYNELSETEKKTYEEKFGDPTLEEAPEEIGNSALNSWLFNSDTIDKVLDHLMTNGIKVQGGDKLGKTIIFAKNHDHAIEIEKRFNLNYPEFKGHFLRVIDNYEPRAQDLLEKFVLEKEEIDPQIAVSVDMMDTGVDAPRVVNLVFFKQVKSATKFWQMIGRGTRLCPNLFAPKEDKKEFLIFDFCQNFEFFDEFPDGWATKPVKSISERIFETKLEIAWNVAQMKDATDDDLGLRKTYLDELHFTIGALDQSRFRVRKELRFVSEYSHRAKWDQLSRSSVIEIKERLSGLPEINDSDELARRFDLLILTIQLFELLGEDTTNHVNRVVRTAQALSKLDNIPVVQQQMPTIRLVQKEEFWNIRKLSRLSEVRINLRDLIKYIEYEERENVYTSFVDHLDADNIQIRQVMQGYVQLKSYKDRVENYLREHKEHIAIHKLTNNEPITASELKQLEEILFNQAVVGSREDFVKEYGDQPLGKFVRSILGMDIRAANNAFAEFLQSGKLRAEQITFIGNIISFLTRNGTIDKAMLFEPPFTDLHQDGIIGLFDEAEATRIISIVDHINKTAEVS
jgi:type I restriction enzyme, R subunit